MKSIFFIARTQFYRNTHTTVSNDFILSLTKSNTYAIHLFWDDSDMDYFKKELERLSPRLIVIFDINCVSNEMNRFSFIYSLGIPISVFLEDTY